MLPGHKHTHGQRKVTALARPSTQWDTLIGAWEQRNADRYGNSLLPHPADVIAQWREAGTPASVQSFELARLYGVEVPENTIRSFDVGAAS